MKSPFDGRSRRLLALILAALFARQLLHVVGALERSAPVMAVAAVALAALLLFALNRWPLWSGVVALTGMSVLSQLHALQVGGPMRHQFAVGVALLGWLCGLAYSRGRDQALPELGAAAALMATYVAASLSKLSHGAWAESAALRSMLAAHRRIDDLSLLGRYAQLIVDNARLAEALSWATLIVQLGAVVYLVGPRSRALWGTLLLVFHLQVAFLTGIYYWDAMTLLVVWSYPWPLPRVLGSS